MFHKIDLNPIIPLMLRPLLLALLGGVLLCALIGAPQQLHPTDSSGMHQNTPKQPQVDVPPAVSSPTASQLQTDSFFSQKAEGFILATTTSPSHALPAVTVLFRDSIQASAILRI